jgi:spore germination protein KB
MNYQSGRMGVAEGLALSFIITVPALFQSTPALLADSSGSACWMTPLLAGLVSSLLLGIQLFLIKRYPGDLLSVAGELFGKYGAYAVGLFFFLTLFSTACVWTRQFA